MQTLIVFSHLRWNFVYQRPQHLLSRLARHWRVVFIEEPMPGEAEQRLRNAEAVLETRRARAGLAVGRVADRLRRRS